MFCLCFIISHIFEKQEFTFYYLSSILVLFSHAIYLKIALHIGMYEAIKCPDTC